MMRLHVTRCGGADAAFPHMPILPLADGDICTGFHIRNIRAIFTCEAMAVADVAGNEPVTVRGRYFAAIRALPMMPFFVVVDAYQFMRFRYGHSA